MNAFDVFSGLVPLLVIGLLLYGVVRLTRRASGAHPVDPAVLTRRIALYGMLYVSMVLTCVGAVLIVDEITATSPRFGNEALAGALALVALGLPVFTALLAFADRRLRSDAHERASAAWSLYFTVASMTSLIAMMVGAYQIISSTIDRSPWNDFSVRSVVMMLAWGAFFITHWVFLRLRHGVRGDVHLAAGSIVGLVALGMGQTGLLAVLLGRIYDDAFDLQTSDLGSESAPWVAMFVVGSAAWIGIWLRQYESAERSQAWYVTVLPVGALAGFVATLATSARVAYLGLVWLVGTTRSSTAADHFESVPALIGIGTTGVVFWLYHRSFINEETRRTSAVQSYDYLLMGASLVSATLGAVLIVSSLLDDGSTDRNLALSGITLLAVGGFTWSRFASTVVASQLGEHGVEELRSPVRRSYLYAVLGIGGFAVLLSGVSALGGVFEDLLDGALGTNTIVDQREQLATVVIVGGVLWFHAVTLRNDHRCLANTEPPPPSQHWPSRIIVLGSPDRIPVAFDRHPNAAVEYWHRTDQAAVSGEPLNLDRLEDLIVAQPGDDVLVLLNGGVPTVIPFER